MRAVLAVALCFVFGTCAGEPNPYGIYDYVSINGETLPTAALTEGWMELRADGSLEIGFALPNQADPMVDEGEFSLGEMEDGCIPYTSQDLVDPEKIWTGSICGDVLTNENAGTTLILHKRR